jgi:hypothetical protein
MGLGLLQISVSQSERPCSYCSPPPDRSSLQGLMLMPSSGYKSLVVDQRACIDAC